VIGRALAGVTAGAVALFAAAGPAAAEEYVRGRSFEHTFRLEDGRQVSCTVEGASALRRDDGASAFEGTAVTSVLGDDPQCREVILQMQVSYVDRAGIERSFIVEGFGSPNIQWRDDDVASGLSVEHGVFFDAPCVQSCSVGFSTSPK